LVILSVAWGLTSFSFISDFILSDRLWSYFNLSSCLRIRSWTSYISFL
jgi:hypothetical protein